MTVSTYKHTSALEGSIYAASYRKFFFFFFFYKISIYLRFLTSGRTADPATLFSHSSVPRVLCVCAGGGGRLFEVKSTVEVGATVPSRV